jgi:hypothetical protein
MTEQAKPLIQIDDQVREMTDDEYEDYKKIQEINQKEIQDLELKSLAKQSAFKKLSKLGLTEAEIEALKS